DPADRGDGARSPHRKLSELGERRGRRRDEVLPRGHLHLGDDRLRSEANDVRGGDEVPLLGWPQQPNVNIGSQDRLSTLSSRREPSGGVEQSGDDSAMRVMSAVIELGLMRPSTNGFAGGVVLESYAQGLGDRRVVEKSDEERLDIRRHG